MPKIIFANLVNHLMSANPTDEYSLSLAAISHREIWFAERGDIVISSSECPSEYKCYVCGLLGIEPDSILTLCPGGEFNDLLADRFNKDLSVQKTVAEYLDRSDHWSMLCFAQDLETLELAERLNLRIEDYQCVSVPHDLRELIYTLNTKSGFKKIANDLKFPLIPGGIAKNRKQLEREVREKVEKYGKIIVKYDRSSNGYGHLVLTDNDHDIEKILSYVEEHLHKFQTQPDEFVIEQYLDFCNFPSVEICTTENDATVTYVSDQRCKNDAYSGLVTPPQIESKYIEAMELIGNKFARFIYEKGFRGVCDLDGGLSRDGKIYLTECNFRRTAGTYIDKLVRRLVGDNYYKERTVVWLQDSLRSSRFDDFSSGYKLLKSQGLCFDHKSKSGVLLLADTLQYDHLWRYLIIAKNQEVATQLEFDLENTLMLQRQVH